MQPHEQTTGTMDDVSQQQIGIIVRKGFHALMEVFWILALRLLGDRLEFQKLQLSRHFSPGVVPDCRSMKMVLGPL